MVVQTKYRDVPFEEVISCVVPEFNNASNAAIWEKEVRGKPCAIVTPSHQRAIGGYFICEGPFFPIQGGETTYRGQYGRMVVCPHIAEIGD